MDDVAAALTLLDGIASRDAITEEERIPAWRAIKAIYHAGVDKEICEGIVRGVQNLGKKWTVGPTLIYYIDQARSWIEWDTGGRVPRI